MTWAEMKHITLQKIDEATGEDNSEYVSQMAPPANEALQLLAGAGKEVIRSYEIVRGNRPPAVRHEGADAGLGGAAKRLL